MVNIVTEVIKFLYFASRAFDKLEQAAYKLHSGATVALTNLGNVTTEAQINRFFIASHIFKPIGVEFTFDAIESIVGLMPLISRKNNVILLSGNQFIRTGTGIGGHGVTGVSNNPLCHACTSLRIARQSLNKVKK